MDSLAINGGEQYKKDSFPKWPIYDDREIENLLEVVKSQNWWRVSGSKVREFEEKFAKFQNVQYCLGVSSGTSALELALSVIGIKDGDEVIIPGLTFISTMLSVINCNGTPVLVDVDKETLCINEELIEKAITPKTKVIIPVHMAGHGCNMEKISYIAQKYNIKIIEDAAHGHGGEWNNKKLGSFGDMSIFSFQNGKLMTCGEGGALLTNNKAYYEKAYLIQDVGRPKNDRVYQHLIRGANYRMNEFQAAILLAQMERVEQYNLLRAKNAAILDDLISQVQGITPLKRSDNANIVTYYMYMFYYDQTFFGGMSREKFVETLNAEGVPCCVCFPVLSSVEFVKQNDFNGKSVELIRRDSEKLPNACLASKNVVWLHHRTLEGKESDLKDIVGAIRKIQFACNMRR